MHLDVAVTNENGISFYRHLGFRDIERGEASNLKGCGSADAVDDHESDRASAAQVGSMTSNIFAYSLGGRL